MSYGAVLKYSYCFRTAVLCNKSSVHTWHCPQPLSYSLLCTIYAAYCQLAHSFLVIRSHDEALPPTIIWLMGMKMSLTKKPMKPITTNPIAVLMVILLNSLRSGFVHLLTKRTLFLANSLSGVTTVSICRGFLTQLRWCESL